MKFGVLVFPGSNCDHDTYNVIAEIARQPVTFLWHDSEDLAGVDAVLVPGGFAYGDYLRTGAIARFSPVMQAVKRFAAGGGLVLGICNGFQILTEAGLLPGALMRNAGLKYICKQVRVRVETADSPFTNQLSKGDVLQIPIGHRKAIISARPEELERLKGEDRIAFRYATPDGRDHAGSQSQRLSEQHCRHLECTAERARDDASPGPVQRTDAGIGGWLEDILLHDRGISHPLIVLSPRANGKRAA